MAHLDPQSWQRLQQKDRAATAHFADHLANPCEICEHFLIAAPGAVELEAAADDVALPSGDDAAIDEVGFRRVRRQLMARRSFAIAGALGAVAAVLIAVVVAGAPSGNRTHDRLYDGLYDGLKGDPVLGLSISAAASSGDPREGWRRIGSGAKLTPADSVVIRYSVATDGVGVLLEDRGDASAARVLGRFALRAGTHDLSIDGAPASVSLESERGSYRLWLVALPAGAPLSDEEARRAVRAGAGRDNQLEVAQLPLEVEARPRR